MADAKIGDVMHYRESGDKFKVEVLGIQEKPYGNTVGDEYRLRILEVIDTNARNPPASGLEFSVWKAKADGNQFGGWYLTDIPIVTP